MYDELRAEYQRWQQRGGRGDFNAGRGQAAPGAQAYTYNVSPEDLEDIFGDARPFSDFFSSIYGQPAGGPTGRAREVCPRRGRDIEATAEISFDEAFRGTTRGIQIGDRRIEARIPPGARSGSRVRLAGQGSPGLAGGPAGDLFIKIEIPPHAQFERDGDNLRVTVPIDVYTAAIGGQVHVPTLDGSVMLKIPPRTQADRVFRMKGKGKPRPEKPAECDDLYARAKLVLPEPLSDNEMETLLQLAEGAEG
jgi:curved DNA-binding protein